MKRLWLAGLVSGLIFAAISLPLLFAPSTSGAAAGGWYFAVSGDSRDCGDLIMPKIASAIEANKERAPVEFYWHLGDFRRIFDIDCDMIKRKYPAYDCKNRPVSSPGSDDMNQYLNEAWDDFITHQVEPFGRLPVYLGIGNHELIAGRTRDDFRRKFQKWLTQGPIHAQRNADAAKHLYTNEGDTSYHLVHKGVDFIYLDNADSTSFTASQITWLSKVLALDAADDSIKTIIVGMHAALPYSTSRNHAMDSTCQGLCSGQQAYDMLYRTQNLTGPATKQKRVYVLASHSHYYSENIFDTPEHRGQVLPGWIIGTAGAEQYIRSETDRILYGYAQIEVKADGTIQVDFKEVTRVSPPVPTDPSSESLTAFCFEANKRAPSNDQYKDPCPCGAAK